MGSPGKRVYGNTVPRVRIPPSPPDKQKELLLCSSFCLCGDGNWIFEPMFDKIVGNDFELRAKREGPKGKIQGRIL